MFSPWGQRENMLYDHNITYQLGYTSNSESHPEKVRVELFSAVPIAEVILI